jgi:type IV pilus assembly protein PilB
MDWLIEHSVVDERLLREWTNDSAQSKGQLSDWLVERGVDAALVAREFARFAGVGEIRVSELNPVPSATRALPAEFARAELVLPLSVDAGVLDCAVAEPSDELKAAIEAVSRLAVRLHVAPVDALRATLSRTYPVSDSVITELATAFSASDLGRLSARGESMDRSLADDGPVAQLVTKVVSEAARLRASDVHIEPRESALFVRFRIDGALTRGLELPSAMASALVSRIKLLAGMNIVEHRRPQDGQFVTETDGREINVRVSSLPTVTGEKCVLRILDKSRTLLRLRELGMSHATAKRFSDVVHTPYGMVLCTGPTGSGKTTTLYATLGEIADSTRNAMTIEDPVEYHFDSINQVQVSDQSGLTFATGLRSILRQDPDIILVGEIRDVETARIAVQSALTGHLVLSSLHATDAAAALQRFLDMGIEPFLVASSVFAVVGQRLLRRICPDCREPYAPTPEEMVFYEFSDGPPKFEFFRGRGCEACAWTGYHDRVGVYELLCVSSSIRHLIVTRASQEEVRERAIAEGMRAIQNEAIDLVVADITTISEVMRSVYTV